MTLPSAPKRPILSQRRPTRAYATMPLPTMPLSDARHAVKSGMPAGWRTALALLAAGLVAGCQDGLTRPDTTVVRTIAEAPPGAAPGTCWGKDVTPAVIETVTEQILLQPAELRVDGTVAEPAIYKTETRQAIVKERRETWFETLCDVDQTSEFISSLQRALAARAFYRGPVNGLMDARTRAAIRRYQAPQGLDSGILSIAAARQLGLVAVERTDG